METLIKPEEKIQAKIVLKQIVYRGGDLKLQ